MEPHQLFLSTLADLERRAAATDEYEALLAASLVRKLLMDAHPLVDRVNAVHRLRRLTEHRKLVGGGHIRPHVFRRHWPTHPVVYA
jgi:hypothetical protein